jgi:CheY-like chemotaxis protein
MRRLCLKSDRWLTFAGGGLLEPVGPGISFCLKKVDSLKMSSGSRTADEERKLSTWMVVEDEPDIYEVLLAMFEMWGIEGVAFVDGEEAIAWIDDVDNGRFRGELPELALLDIRLPGAVSGPAVGERLRKSSILGDVAIILSTAYKLTVEEEAQAIEQAGADKLLYKPLPKFNELQQVLETVIAARRAKAAQNDKE